MASIEPLTPEAGDFKRAGALIAGWATDDLRAFHAVIQEARHTRRGAFLLAALAEISTLGMELRGSPDNLEALRRDIAKYAGMETNDND